MSWLHNTLAATSRLVQCGTNGPPFHAWQYGAALMLAATLLLLRQPSQFLDPQLAFEDGAVFFAHAYNLRPLDAITYQYAGYWHLLPRLVAEAGTWLPFQWVPAFYHLAALLIAAMASSWFYLPHFRHLVRDDRLRLLFVVFMACLPQVDGLMMLAYVQWFLVVWAILVVVMRLPTQPWGEAALFLLYLLAVWTAPALILLVPAWLWRWAIADSQRQRAWITVLIAGSLLAFGLTSALPHAPNLVAENLPRAILDVVHGASYIVFAQTLLGRPLADQLTLGVGWFATIALSACCTVLLGQRLARASTRGLWVLGLALGLLGLGTTALYLMRSVTYGFMFASAVDSLPFGNTRYFYPGAAILLLLIFLAIDEWWRTHRGSAPWISTLLLVWLLLYWPTFRLPDWTNEAAWSVYASLFTSLADRNQGAVVPSTPSTAPTALDRATAKLNEKYPIKATPHSIHPRPPYLAQTWPLNVPIASAQAGWRMTLFAPAEAGLYDFPEGVRLLGFDQGGTAQEAVITLYWQGEAAGDDGAPYTAFVHVRDGAGQRVAGFDVRLPPVDAGRAWEDLFVTRHPLSLPETIAPGTYDLAVGLYRFADEQIVPGSEILLPQAVSLP